MNKIIRVVVFLGITVVSMLLLFVGVNFEYFTKQIGFWWGENVSKTPVEVVEKREPNTIYIESLGIQAPLVYTDETEERKFQEALAFGVVHYPGTAEVGEKGNAFFFGHSSDFPTKPGNYKTVFALLPHIQMGQEIIVTDAKGVVYKYETVATHIVKPTDTQWLKQGDRSEAMITLQTSYPVGTAINRFLVIGKLKG